MLRAVNGTEQTCLNVPMTSTFRSEVALTNVYSTRGRYVTSESAPRREQSALEERRETGLGTAVMYVGAWQHRGQAMSGGCWPVLRVTAAGGLRARRIGSSSVEISRAQER